MELEKKPYEISIWDDVWNEKGYYEEQKVCNIGSNNMTTSIRAFNPKMVSNINGSNTFTFDLNFRYWDDNLGDFVENPFVSLLYNERKIKVREGTPPNAKWYDLIIKDVTENSEKKVFTYTAKDQYINELSKTGYELVFDDKLENSVGTVNELAEQVLMGSDWKVAEDSVILQEQQEEPLYKINPILDELKQEGGVVEYSLGVIPVNLEGEESTSISYKFDRDKDKIYGFYSDITSQSSKVQILIINGPVEVDEDNIIVNGRNYYINTTWEKGLPSFASEMEISTYRGKRYVKQTGLQFDEKINKYVSVYEARKRDEEGNIIVPEVGTIPQWERRYVFSKTKYLNPALIQSSIVNPRALDGLVGWQNRYSYKVPGAENGGSRIKNNSFQASIKEYEKNGEKNFLSYFEKIDSDAKGRELYVNTAITDNLDLFPDGIKAGDRYCLSLRCGYIRDTFTGKLDIDTFKPANPSYTVDGNGFYADAETEEQERSYYNQILVTIAPHEWSSDGYKHYYTNMNSYAVGYAQPPIFDDDDRITFVMTCFKSLSFEDLKDVSKEITLMLAVLGPKRGFCFTDVQFFPYMTDKKGNLLRPGEIPSLDENSQIEKEYYSYNPDDDYTKEEEIRFEVSKNELPFDYKLIIDSSHPYEKKRTLRASKSNRFNLISELCELFECWVKFEVERDNNTGKIRLDEEGKPKKWVRFYDYKDVETQNYAGFKYGINLKSINRNIESDVIASKLIVENNSNEFAEDGFCSISRASLNPTGENFLFDFNYYIRKRLLDAEAITKELNTYYNNLRTKNNERDELIQKSSGLSLSIIKNESQVQSYGLLQTESDKEAEKLKTEVKQISGKEWNHADNMGSKELLIKSKVQAIKYASSRADMYKQLAEKASVELKKNKKEYETTQKKLEKIANDKQGLHLDFYTKYSRFIQEGSWISEDYTDDNLYYLDAQGTLHASAFPKVNYTIDIIDVSQIEGFENFNFSLGEKTTVEDVEFFGWALDNSGRPYKEEVIISEITTLYDSPEQNKIKVQNYKTDFEDLFQRITTSTQKLEYKTGSYNKASSILNSDGTIKESVLQGSLNNSSVVLSNAADSTVRWDASGIVTWSTADPNQKLIFGNGGIFMISGKDATPRLMLSGAGLNADYIRAGQIDTDLIRIMSAGKPAFGWDSRGISAYKFSKTDDGVQYDPFTFVRLDQFGLYGIKGGDASFDASEPDNDDGKVGIEKIKKHSNFSLTWNGFVIKSKKRENGYISITEDNDFEVYSNNVPVVKIGQLDENGARFGLRLKDSKNKTTLEQDNTGKLWLSDYISFGNITNTGAPVQIGILTKQKYIDPTDTSKKYAQVFNANDKFIVYENGRIKATDGYFTGTIQAEFGTIGGFQIETERLYSVNKKLILNGTEGTITAKAGTIGGFTIDENKLYSTNENVTLELDGANGSITAKSGYIGGFTICSNSLFSPSGNLTLNGTSGEIIAKSGVVGGFVLRGNKLESQKKDSSGEPYIILDGGSGEPSSSATSKIAGFKISDSHMVSLTASGRLYLDGAQALIELGDYDSRIKLSGAEGKIYIGANVTAPEVGPVTAGQIIINGEGGTIESGTIGSTQGWSITPNEAIFNNITARGSIKASVLEYGEVQTVGGILLVRPSSRITKLLEWGTENTIVFEVESNHGFHKGDLCLITPSLEEKIYCTVVAIPISEDGESKKRIQVKFDRPLAFLDYVGLPILDLGQPKKFEPIEQSSSDFVYVPGKYYYKDGDNYLIDDSQECSENRDYYRLADGSVGIGINASEDNTMVEGQSISVFELLNNQGHKKFHVLLGKIPQSDKFPELEGFAGTYGLYADNVLLNGSLVTAPGAFGTSSGLRTKRTSEQIRSDKFNKVIDEFGETKNLDGEILLWAGAKDTSQEAIKNAPFYVNENGCLYAKGAHFAGSVMSDAIIAASEIQAARIIGKGKEPALTITDASMGIVFSGTRNGEATDFLKLSDNSMKVNVEDVDLSSSSRVIINELRTTQSGELLSMAENYIKFSNGRISLNDGEMKIELGKEVATFNETEIKTPQRLKVGGGIYYYTKNSDEAAYLPRKINEEVVGYDLYVY